MWLVLVHGSRPPAPRPGPRPGGHRRDGDRAGLPEPHRSVAVGVPARGRRRRRDLVARPHADAAGRCSSAAGARPGGARRPRDHRLQLPPRSDRAGRRRSAVVQLVEIAVSVSVTCGSATSRGATSPSRTPRSRRRRPDSNCSSRRCCFPTTATTADTSTIASVDTRACSRSTSVSDRIPLIGALILGLAVAGAVIGIRRATRARRSPRGDRGPVGGRGQHPLPHGGAVLLPDHAVGPVLRVRRGRRPPWSWSGASAIDATSPCSRRCRCCTSSRSTRRSCRATSPMPATSTGRLQQPIGPTDPRVTPVFDAVGPTHPTRRHHRVLPSAHDDALHRPAGDSRRTLIDRISQRADYFAQQRGVDFYQPRLTEAQGHALGFEIVWSDDHWILWKVVTLLDAAAEGAGAPSALFDAAAEGADAPGVPCLMRPPKALTRPACRTDTHA